MFNILQYLKSLGKLKISVNSLDQLFKKQGRQQFNYDVFKNAYDSDTRLQNIVKDFDQSKITLNSDESDDLKTSSDSDKKSKSKDTVSKMAKDAVDLSKL